MLNEEDRASRALLKFLIDAKKLGVNEKDFFFQTADLTAMSDEKIQLLWNFLSGETAISELTTNDDYNFRELEWRLEAKVKSSNSY